MSLLWWVLVLPEQQLHEGHQDADYEDGVSMEDCLKQNC